jgi:hypothetical protein
MSSYIATWRTNGLIPKARVRKVAMVLEIMRAGTMTTKAAGMIATEAAGMITIKAEGRVSGTVRTTMVTTAIVVAESEAKALRTKPGANSQPQGPVETAQEPWIL